MEQPDIILLDTETTGLASQDEVIQLAFLPLLSLQEESKIFKTSITIEDFLNLKKSMLFSKNFKPSAPIHPKAFAVHGIKEKDLQACPASNTVTLPAVRYIIGHNISFDKRLLLQSNPAICDSFAETKFICTMALAKALKPTFGYTGASLTTLVKHFYPIIAETFPQDYHDASTDCLKTLLVLFKLLEALGNLVSWDDMVKFQESLQIK
jgi:DNA polymerase III epsilon subunit-like protein